MLVITTNDVGTRPVILTVTSDREGTTLHVIRPTPGGKPMLAGEELASVVLSKADTAELKRNL